MLTDLILFRHGKAVRQHEARDDFSRGLTPRGRVQAAAQAVRLKEAGCDLQLALVSTALRAAETWDACQLAFPETQVQMMRMLYLAAPNIYLNTAKSAKASRVMIIAHDPGLHELACSLMKGDTGLDRGQADLREHLPTSGVAWFSADPSASSGFKLRQFWAPEPILA
ncbi:SixA phosphatase family protein [Aquidulcibacter sp.]|jgi:phosphohistidine phosphatase|uniref:SixA phosphatase family protein n=1 Tax=Aquidulcibacter sp. TaxID=2052990 RepID=UPI0037BE2372